MSGLLGPAAYLNSDFKLYAPYDAAATGAITSPLIVKSADGLSETTVSVANNAITTVNTPNDLVITPVLGNMTINSEVVVSTESDINAASGLRIAPSNTEGTGALFIQNGDNTAQYAFYVPAQAGGGLSEDDLQIWGYSNAGNQPVLDINVQGTAMLVGSQLQPVQLQVNGPDGPGRVYDDRYNLAPNPNAGDTVEFGTNAIVGGAVLQVLGTNGTGRVYDDKYNTPPVFIPPLQMLIDPTTANLLPQGTASCTYLGSIKFLTLDAAGAAPQDIPALFLGGIAPPGQVVSKPGDTYGFKFTSVVGNSKVGVYDPDSTPGTPDWTFTPVVGDTYWFACNANNTFTFVGSMNGTLPA